MNGKRNVETSENCGPKNSTSTRSHEDIARYQRQVIQLTDENIVLADRVSELEKRLEAQDAWEKFPASKVALETNDEHDLVRDQLADFALKVLRGNVSIVHREV